MKRWDKEFTQRKNSLITGKKKKRKKKGGNPEFHSCLEGMKKHHLFSCAKLQHTNHKRKSTTLAKASQTTSREAYLERQTM